MTCIPGLRGIPPMPSRPDAIRTGRWRRHQLMAAGLDELTAHRLAVRADVDIHAVLTLKDAGASGLLERMDDMDQDSRHV
jgi:hypothetical protein